VVTVWLAAGHAIEKQQGRGARPTFAAFRLTAQPAQVDRSRRLSASETAALPITPPLPGMSCAPILTGTTTAASSVLLALEARRRPIS
jgi:hypothetical protein